MQTFLPFRDFDSCARHLDYRRLGKQRVEAFQLLCGLRDPWALEERERRLTEQGKAVKPIQNGWTNHPASKMWRGHTEMLGNYMNTMISEWVARGYNNTMNHRPSSDCPTPPDWMLDATEMDYLIRTHRSNLIRKLPEHYGPMWPSVSPDMEYHWPVN